MAKQLYAIPVRKVIDGDLYVLADSAEEAMEIAKDEIDYVYPDAVIVNATIPAGWEIASDKVYDADDVEKFFAINYEEPEV